MIAVKMAERRAEMSAISLYERGLVAMFASLVMLRMGVLIVRGWLDGGMIVVGFGSVGGMGCVATSFQGSTERKEVRIDWKQ